MKKPLQILPNGTHAREICSLQRNPNECNVNLHTLEGCRTFFYSEHLLKVYRIENLMDVRSEGFFYFKLKEALFIVLQIGSIHDSEPNEEEMTCILI